MKRIEIYYVGDQRVSKETWYATLVNKTNLQPLKVFYEEKEKTIEDLSEENEYLKKEIARLLMEKENDTYTPHIMHGVCYPDWTVRPENLPRYEISYSF